MKPRRHTHVRHFLLVAAAAALLNAGGIARADDVAKASPAQSLGGADACFRDTLASLDAIAGDLPAISKCASDVAELYLKQDLPMAFTGDPLFEFELVGRCGGLMRLDHFTRLKDPKWTGIVVYGIAGPESLKNDASKLKKIHDDRKCKTVVFGRAEWIEQLRKDGAPIDFSVDNKVTGELALEKSADGKAVVSRDDAANIMAGWAWTGELAAACTRMGKMPTMFKGYAFPGGKEREKAIAGAKFHEAAPPAVPALQIGGEFLAIEKKLLNEFYPAEVGHIRAAAREAMKAKAGGGALYCFADSHAIGHAFDRPRDPGLFVQIGDWSDNPEPTFKKGDYVFGLGYSKVFATFGYAENDGQLAKKARAAGATLLFAAGGMGEQNPPPAIEGGEILIDQRWPWEDSIVPFPGYDIKVLAGSGVIQTMLYNMLCAEMLAPTPEAAK